jgi:CheY-like chemotaxis protein
MVPQLSDLTNIQTNSFADKISRIVAADDQLINLEVLKTQLTEVGLHSKCTYCIDGQLVIDEVKRIMEDEITASNEGDVIRPVDFMLLDFQMPKKNGLQVLLEVRELYAT